MQVSRPVIAFALLSQASDALQTDLLSGVSLLIRPIVRDLAGKLFDPVELARRMGECYGLSLPSTALESLAPRLVSAQVLETEPTPNGIPKAIYCTQPEFDEAAIQDESSFQAIFDDFLTHSTPLLQTSKIEISHDDLISAFQRHLTTLDFNAILARPIVKVNRPGICGGSNL